MLYVAGQTNERERIESQPVKYEAEATVNNQCGPDGCDEGDCESEDDPSSVDSVVKCSRCAFREATVFTDEHGKTGKVCTYAVHVPS